MNKYIRFGIATIEDVTRHILDWKDGEPGRVDIDTHSVGITSLRLRTFARDFSKCKDLRCPKCNTVASFFAIENFSHSTQQTKPHLNLYGLNAAGEEILFTHDHIKARVFGGADNLGNTQTMCYRCNQSKGQEEGQLAKEFGLSRKVDRKKKK